MGSFFVWITTKKIIFRPTINRNKMGVTSKNGAKFYNSNGYQLKVVLEC